MRCGADENVSGNDKVTFKKYAVRFSGRFVNRPENFTAFYKRKKTEKILKKHLIFSEMCSIIFRRDKDIR